MNILIDNKSIPMHDGYTLLDYINALGLDSRNIADRPIAAMLGGEVFNLCYIPKRECAFTLIRYSDEEGRRVYERTLQFILIAAVRKLFPDAKVLVQYSMGQGVYLTINKQNTLSYDDVELLRQEMVHIISSAFPLRRLRRSIEEAISRFSEDGQYDKVKLLGWRKFSYFDFYDCPDYSDYADYFYGEMAPDTGYVRVFALSRLGDSLLMLLPDRNNPEIASTYVDSPKLLAIFRESEQWGRFMHCSTASELNTRVENGSIRELVRVNEALHEKNFSRIADAIIHKGVKAVMLAGPSSSGKTTSANRIATQLRASGLDPIMLSLDDYYIDRDKVERDENGKLDLEHINTLDIKRFNYDLKQIIAGDEVSLPRFNVLTGRREDGQRVLRLSHDQPLIVEGIHALNPIMLGDIPPNKVYRIYVSALTTLNLDDHNRVRTTDLRLLRRLVRDYATRGASMEHTLDMWESVRRGETRWIFPYQENADCIINTTLLYEISVMKKYVYPLLTAVSCESRCYSDAQSIIKFLNYFVSADIENEIPPTSILREFIGGNSFYQ